jgi:predicted peptidase
MLFGAGLLAGCAGSGATSPYANQAGQQVAVSLNDTDAPFGFHQYLPPGYGTSNSDAAPLLVFLHGSGERGDGTTLLPRVLRHGPPRVIQAGEWPDDRPFVVLSPQLDTTRGAWPVDKIDAFIDHAVETYQVDPSRIYLTGLSLGGHGTWTYAASHPDRIAAAAPVCGDGTLIEEQGTSYCALSSLPVWAFHGADDPVVDPKGSTVPVRQVNQCTPPPSPEARLTLFPGVGHDSWSLVYDGSGHDAPQDGTPFNQSLYDWLLQFER